jgi:DNA-binding transcriptional regulator YiaG
LAYAGIDLDDENVINDLAQIPWIHWATFAGESQAIVVREASTPVRAALDAVEAIRAAAPQAEFHHVVDDLVSIPDIARRMGVNRETVRTWVTGARGPGGFPRPRSVIGGNIQVWDWGTVAEWLEAEAGYSDGRRPLSTQQVCAIQAAIEKHLKHGLAVRSAVQTWSPAHSGLGSLRKGSHVNLKLVEARPTDSGYTRRAARSLETHSEDPMKQTGTEYV